MKKITRDLPVIIGKWQSRQQPPLFYQFVQGDVVEVVDITITATYASFRLINNDIRIVGFTDKMAMKGFHGIYEYDEFMGIKSIFVIEDDILPGDHTKDVYEMEELINAYDVYLIDDMNRKYTIRYATLTHDENGNVDGISMTLDGISTPFVIVCDRDTKQLDEFTLIAEEDFVFRLQKDKENEK